MTRLVPVTVLVMLLAASGVASAQTTGGGSLPSGATIDFEHRQIWDPSQKKFVEPQAGSTDLFHYFNLAHCNCAKANASSTDQTTTNHVGNFRYLVRLSGESGVTTAVPIDYWVGTSCNDDTTRNSVGTTCEKVGSTPDINTNLFTKGGDNPEFNLYQVVNAKGPADAVCTPSNNITAPIYAFVNTSGMPNTYDYQVSQTAGLLSTDTGTSAGIDTQPPPLPTKIGAAGIDGGIHVSWSPPTSGTTDIAYYQALCAKVDGTPARSQPSDAPQFVTTASLCNVGGDPTITPTPITPGEGDVPVTAPEGQLAALDKSFVCGQSASGTAPSLDISGLDNGTQYQVILVSADLHGNYAATYFTSTVTPVPSTDFWEDLHDRGSKTEGGLCLLAETYGDDSALTGALRAFRDDTLGGSQAGRWLTDAYYASLGRLGPYVHGSIALRMAAAVVLAPAVGFALLWYWLTLPGVLGLIAAAWLWRHRRQLMGRLGRRILGTPITRFATVLAVIALGAGPAHAGGYEPYWENDPTADENASQAETSAPEDVHWHVGIRVGPYVPDIDKQFGMNPGPYQQMFGGERVLPMLDVDRVLWSRFGQVAVGLSAGYMQKTAHTFTLDSMPTDPSRARAADTNTFRLIPFALSATYRFTWLDDEYGIPVVPYVKGGLAYDVWWLSVSSGGLSEACKGGGMAAGCPTTKSLGASLGVQGSIGLAIRAERIDASTAQSMRQSGIQHAGIYGELSLAKVDGFGSDTKLSVGDRTWFAGVDFEF